MKSTKRKQSAEETPAPSVVLDDAQKPSAKTTRRSSRVSRASAAPIIEAHEDESSELTEEERKARVESLCKQLDVEIESRCEMMRADAEFQSLSLRRELKLMLARLPKKVKEMSVEEFESKYNGSVLNVIEEDGRKAMEEVYSFLGNLQGAGRFGTMPTTPSRGRMTPAKLKPQFATLTAASSSSAPLSFTPSSPAPSAGGRGYNLRNKAGAANPAAAASSSSSASAFSASTSLEERKKQISDLKAHIASLGVTSSAAASSSSSAADEESQQ